MSIDGALHEPEQVRALVAKGALSPGVMSTSDCRGDYAALSALGVEVVQEPAVRPTASRRSSGTTRATGSASPSARADPPVPGPPPRAGRAVAGVLATGLTGGMFTDAELEYLRSQRLGRLATEAPDGTLQNSPVGFGVDAEAGVILIRGRDLGNTRKFHNIAANGKAAFVVDDIASVNPWIVRCFEVRGTAEALTGQQPPNSYMSPELIRIHPRRIISWGLGPDGKAASRRTVG